MPKKEKLEGGYCIMVQRDNFRILSDEEKEQYKFGFCENCPFYECELVEEYKQFRERHIQINKSQVPTVKSIAVDSLNHTGNRGVVIQATAVSVKRCEQDNGTCLGNVICPANMDADILSYDQSKLKDGCTMSGRHVCQIECGRQNVTKGIGDHFKIETDDEGNICEGITDKWEPAQPVFISAQTGQGKNYFIENTLIPYVRELNYQNRTNQRVLILSNRLALKKQIKNRLDGNDDSDDGETKIYPYKEYADVMTYQSLLCHEKCLKRKQEKPQSRYIFVICDEAHFFTSDAMFNPHTQKILEAIVRLFQNAVRVYMSATPYQCLEYIIKYEEEYQRIYLNWNKRQDKWKGEMMAFYHFKRDYGYLDVKTYSSISELYNEIVESVVRKKEKWLIFIDDKEKCVKEKDKLEGIIENKENSLVVEDKKSKKKDEEDTETDKVNEAEKKDGEDAGTNKDHKVEKKVKRVYVVDANSKKEPIYQEIVKNERLNKDTYVLISTSVLDNGINLGGINNIVVSDMDKSKCLQMVGRARVSDINDRKILYVKRFGANDVEKQIDGLERQRDAYHKYELAYGELRNPLQSRGYSEYQFLDGYYNEEGTDWNDAKHWFGRPVDKPTELYLNEIAKSLVDEKLISQYERIRDEMIEESSKESEQQSQSGVIHTGQKYLEHQLSWFGKKYCVDDDITYADKEKAKKEFLAFLGEYAEKGTEVVSEEEMNQFSKKFIKLFDTAFYKSDKNSQDYKALKMNRLLEKENIKYRIEGKAQVGPWTVVRCD